MTDDRVIPSGLIGHAAAAALVEAGLAAARSEGFEAAVAVVDATGAMRAFGRADGASSFTADVAAAKARTSAASGMATHIWNVLLADPANAPLSMTIGMMFVAGGYPLKHGGASIGAIGVSGGPAEQDRAAAARAIAKLGFPID